MDTEWKLCEEVQKHSHLYDSSLTEYRDSVKVQNSWIEIGEKLDIGADAAKKKWKYLRECYVKSKKYMEAKGKDERSRKVSKYYEKLAWLSPFVKHREAETKVYVKSDSMHYGEEHGVVEKDLPNLVSMGTDSDASSVCSIAKIQHEQSAVSKRARTEVESRLLQTPKDNDGEDEFTTFGKTVANTIRKLPRVSQIFVRKKINDILFEAEIQAMRSASEDEPISMTDFFDRIS